MSETAITKYMRSEIVKQRFAEVVGEYNSGAYVTSVLLAVANDPTGLLQQCAPESIYVSALRAASMRLSVDSSIGQAYLVPFKGKATLIVGYKGLYDMAIRTGRYRYINVGPVYEGEVVEEDRITGYHRLNGYRQSDLVIGWLGAFEMITGYAKTIYMTVEEIHEYARKYSKGYDNPKSIWKANPRAMEQKTVLRILLRKWGYLDPSDLAVVDQVEQENAEAEDIPAVEIVEAPKPHPAETAPSEPGYFADDLEFYAETEFCEAEPIPAEAEPQGQNGNGTNRPYPPAVVREKIAALTAEFTRKGEKPTNGQRAVLPHNLELCFAGMSESDKIRRSVMRYLTGKNSTNDLTDAEILALRRWLNVQQDSGGEWIPDPLSVREANLIWRESLIEQGQGELF